MLSFLADVDIQLIAKRFFPKQSVRISPVAKGLLNQNLLLETNSQKFILKIFRAELKKEVLDEMHQVMGYLKENGLPVPSLIEFSEHQGIFVGLYSYLPGKNPGLYSNSLTRVATMGDMLGRVHQALAEYATVFEKKNESPEALAQSVSKRLDMVHALQEKAERERPKHADQMIVFLKRHAERLATENWDNMALFDRLPHHLCHGDFHTKNLPFQGETLTGVLDWEKCGWGCHGFEVVRSIVYNCRRTASAFNWRSVEVYVKAYLRHMRLTEEECLYAFPLVYQRMLFGTWMEEQYLTGREELWDNVLRRHEINEYLFKNKRQISQKLERLLRFAPAN